MFKRLFGGEKGAPSAPPPPKGRGEVSQTSTLKTVDAIQKLGETEDLLTKRRSLLEKKIAQETERAKEYTRANNKKAALMALKKKKMYEGQLEQVENNILRVNEQQMMLENQRTTVETVSALRNAAQASKQTMQEMKIEHVDQVLDEISEQQDQMAQMQDALAMPIGGAGDIDEDELLAELKELEAQELDNELLEPAPVPSTRVPARAEAALPSVPKQKAQPQKTPEELELEALQAEMAL